MSTSRIVLLFTVLAVSTLALSNYLYGITRPDCWEKAQAMREGWTCLVGCTCKNSRGQYFRISNWDDAQKYLKRHTP